jgi:hypothetical protein
MLNTALAQKVTNTAVFIKNRVDELYVELGRILAQELNSSERWVIARKIMKKNMCEWRKKRYCERLNQLHQIRLSESRISDLFSRMCNNGDGDNFAELPTSYKNPITITSTTRQHRKHTIQHDISKRIIRIKE